MFYQESATEVPIRERTKSFYMKAESERQIRSHLKDQPINIEYIQPIDETFLEYEKQNEDFKVLEI